MKSHIRHIESKSARDLLLHGEALSLLRTLEADSIDLVCTDPPYGIGFRGNAWDSFEPAHQQNMLSRELRRKQRCDGRKASGFQDATIAGSYDRSRRGLVAFEAFLREVMRECLRVLRPGALLFVTMTPRQDALARALVAIEDAGFETGFSSLYWTFASGFPKAINIGKALARRGDPRHARTLGGAYGGFQPKPAVEVMIVAMKPLSHKSYLEHARETGKGVTWLNDCRIPSADTVVIHDAPAGTFAGGERERGSTKNYRTSGIGRFPANLLVGDDVLGPHSRFFSLDAWERELLPFLISPKASKRERDFGLAGPTRPGQKPAGGRANFHPTVKPLKLMAYLIALGSRPGDLVLDPFLGSGTTAMAAKLLGRRYIGIERDSNYLAIARQRVAATSRP